MSLLRHIHFNKLSRIYHINAIAIQVPMTFSSSSLLPLTKEVVSVALGAIVSLSSSHLCVRHQINDGKNDGWRASAELIEEEEQQKGFSNLPKIQAQRKEESADSCPDKNPRRGRDGWMGRRRVIVSFSSWDVVWY
eukprot:scaffold5437_cov137-Skeletonema_menzelii.AAC.7